MHTAIIMDGNGRWATRRGLPRLEGHRRGASAVRRTVEAARREDISDLTLYAFSSDNWKRPRQETSGLMRLLCIHLQEQLEHCRKNDIRLSVIGRRDRLPAELPPLIQSAERDTRSCGSMHLRIAIDYSSRDAIIGAARFCASWADWEPESFSAAMPVPDVDLLIRTGGEQRISDFLLWESAYAELVFLPVLWPDFTAEDLRHALDEFHSRQRRFGGVPKQTPDSNHYPKVVCSR